MLVSYGGGLKGLLDVKGFWGMKEVFGLCCYALMLLLCSFDTHTIPAPSLSILDASQA